MSISNNIISTNNISINDPKQLLGSDSYALNDLCRNSNINKYSRRKPVIGSNETNTGLSRTSIGVSANSIPIESLSDTNWSKIIPIDNFRLGDFGGYNHLAKNPLSSKPNISEMTIKFYPDAMSFSNVYINQEDAWFFFGSRTKKKMIPVVILAFRDTNTGASSDTKYLWSCAPLNKVPTDGSLISFKNGFDYETRQIYAPLLPKNRNGIYKWLMTMITIDDATRLIGEGKLREEFMLPVGTNFNGLIRDNDYLFLNDTSDANSLNSTYPIANPDESLIEIGFLYPRRFAESTDQKITWQVRRTNGGTFGSGSFIMNNNIPYDGTLWKSIVVTVIPTAIWNESTYEMVFTYTKTNLYDGIDWFSTSWSDLGTVKQNWVRSGNSQSSILTFPMRKKAVIRNN